MDGFALVIQITSMWQDLGKNKGVVLIWAGWFAFKNVVNKVMNVQHLKGQKSFLGIILFETHLKCEVLYFHVR